MEQSKGIKDQYKLKVKLATQNMKLIKKKTIT